MISLPNQLQTLPLTSNECPKIAKTKIRIKPKLQEGNTKLRANVKVH